jgi:hypothetical protein
MPPIILMNLAVQDAFCRDSTHGQQPSQRRSKVTVNSTTFRLLPLRPRAVSEALDAALASTPEHRDGEGGLL